MLGESRGVLGESRVLEGQRAAMRPEDGCGERSCGRSWLSYVKGLELRFGGGVLKPGADELLPAAQYQCDEGSRSQSPRRRPLCPSPPGAAAMAAPALPRGCPQRRSGVGLEVAVVSRLLLLLPSQMGRGWGR